MTEATQAWRMFCVCGVLYYSSELLVTKGVAWLNGYRRYKKTDMDDSTRQATRLWTLAQPKVSAFVTSVVRDFKDRDDVLQDIAVAVVESIDSYDSQRPFDAWAMGVARNQMKLYFRRRQRDRLVFDEATIQCVEATFSRVTDVEARKLELLNNCLGRLEGRAQELCTLRYKENLKPAAISETLGMAGTAVRKSLQRIREQLRDCIDRDSAAEGV